MLGEMPTKNLPFASTSSCWGISNSKSLNSRTAAFLLLNAAFDLILRNLVWVTERHCVWRLREIKVNHSQPITLNQSFSLIITSILRLEEYECKVFYSCTIVFLYIFLIRWKYWKQHFRRNSWIITVIILGIETFAACNHVHVLYLYRSMHPGDLLHDEDDEKSTKMGAPWNISDR